MQNWKTPTLRLTLAALVLSTGCRSGGDATPAAATTVGGATLPPPASIVASMTAVADWQLANPSNHKLWEWHQAPFWAGLVSHYRWLKRLGQQDEGNDLNADPSLPPGRS